MLKYIILIFIFTSCESPKKIDKKLIESYKRYLFIQKVSNDSIITDQLSIFYLDSLNVNKLEFDLFIVEFNKDIQFRKIVLQELTKEPDTLLYRKIYDNIERLKNNSQN